MSGVRPEDREDAKGAKAREEQKKVQKQISDSHLNLFLFFAALRPLRAFAALRFCVLALTLFIMSIVPVPKFDLAVRPGQPGDVPFMDSLQKRHSKAVGWMPTKQFEGKVALGHVLIAEANGKPVGYLVGNDRYFKRDDVGIIYQVNVEPGRQRGLVGASLLKAQFERSAYGCRLYCCWCAQDLAANRFWEAMGFVPLAYRAGSLTKGKNGTPRVHIFWQKRIVRGDEVTPWWFPSKTDGGALRADRIALPIPPGTHWSEARPLVVPGSGEEEAKALPGPRRRVKRATKVARPVEVPKAMNGMRFAIPKPGDPPAAPEPTRAEPAPKREKPKCDPRLVEAARELRDRFLERLNAEPWLLEGEGKYDVARPLPAAKGWHAEVAGPKALPTPAKLLPAA